MSRILSVALPVLALAALACAPAPASTATSPAAPAAIATFPPSEAPAATATPEATPLPPQPKGALIWQAVLDSSGSDLDLASRYVVGDQGAAAIQPLAGGIRVAILRTGGPTGASFKQSLPASFIGEMDFRVTPGSDIQFVWRVRSGDQLHLIQVDTRREAMELVFADPTDWPTRLQPLGARIPIPGLLSGRLVSVGVVAESPRYTLYLDGRRVAEIADPRLTPKAGPFAIGAFGEKGEATIVGLRAYALPGR